VTGNDIRWPEVTQKWRHLIGSHLEVAVEGRKLGHIVHLTFCKAVARSRRQSCDRKWRQVTSSDRKWSGSHLEVAVEGRKLAYAVHFTSYKPFVAGGGSHVTGNDVLWPQLTGSDPEVTSFDRKWPRSGCRRPKTGVYCTFHFLQGCSSQEEAVTWQELTSRDFRWPEVTRNWRHLTGSHLKVAVQGRKLAYTAHFTSYKAVARRRRQSRDRKWRHVTSGDWKWTRSDIILPEVTWKWL